MAITIENKQRATYGTTVTMELVHCCSCGVPFAMPAELKKSFQKTQDFFTCPNRHQQQYSRSTADVLQEKLDKEKAETDRLRRIADEKIKEASSWRDNWQKQIEEKKKVAAKLKRTEKRIANGVCHCCNRTFENLQRHMISKHPEQIKK